MAETLLDKISRNCLDTCLTDKWRNSKFGEIVDIKDDGNYRFVDYIVDEDVKIRKQYVSETEKLTCPIIATGIVGYWLHNKDSLGVKSIFEGYYNLKMSQYEKEHECDDDAWERDLKKEFVCRHHILAEKKAIMESEAIFSYVTESDIKKIRSITANYIKYTRSKHKNLYPPEYPSNRMIEDTFFKAYSSGGAHECMEWFRTEYDLPYMRRYFGSEKREKSQLSGRWKEWHEISAPAYILEEYDDFDDGVLIHTNGGMMDEINDNLKNCQTHDDRVRYIISLLQPFKEFADAFYPRERIDERKRAIKRHEEWEKNYAKMSDDAVDEKTGDPIRPRAQIEAIDKSTEDCKEDIKYWKHVQDRFYWFAQHGLSEEFIEDENHEMCRYLGRWWSLMIIFSEQLAALVLTYGIKLMDVQERCEIYLNWHFIITDYKDSKFVTSIEHARKLLAEVDAKKDKEENQEGNRKEQDNNQITDNHNKANQEDNKSRKNREANIPTLPPVYISYNWDSNSIADDICAALSKANIDYLRDNKDCKYRENIRDFENRLGDGDMIVAIICEPYLKSIHCMRELALVSQKGLMEERLFPIVNLNGKQRDCITYSEYRKYWISKQKKRKSLEDIPGVQSPIYKELEDIDFIINELSKIWEYIKNINSPSWDVLCKDDYQMFIKEIKTRLENYHH